MEPIERSHYCSTIDAYFSPFFFFFKPYFYLDNLTLVSKKKKKKNAWETRGIRDTEF